MGAPGVESTQVLRQSAVSVAVEEALGDGIGFTVALKLIECPDLFAKEPAEAVGGLVLVAGACLAGGGDEG